MSLPFLPGNSANKRLGKERFHKSQHFDYSNGMALLVGSEKPGIGGELLPGQKKKLNYSVYPKGQGSDLPSWVALDKQVLCFEGYFQEAVSEVCDETHRVRKCNIYFYLEDDTIQVVEPKYKNSGIVQGTLIRRHRIPLPPPDDDHFYNVFHFNVNQQVVLYSRTFTLTSCDSFTRNFLTKLGVRLNDPAPVPDDPYRNLREQTEKSMNPLRPYERHDTLKQFLDHDGKVLRFSCIWDETDSVREARELILHYFLADDTIEILEVIHPNSGRDFSKFLHRCRVPKNAPSTLKQPGQTTNPTVLNVIDSMTRGKHYILDSLKTGAVHEDFYKDWDLVVGGEVNVFGRRLLITDCDDFTKDYYRSKHGREDLTPVQYKPPAAPKPPRLVPPYNGFGSEEDSLSSCQGLLPRPPKKDFHKFMEKDRCGLESNVLNFRAKMATTDPVNGERVFIISFYLSDDSISVFEHPQRNSGVLGGKFLERGRVKKPGQELFKSEPSECFSAQDLYVGATLCLKNHLFQLLDADEYTLSYMERHAEEFPKANVGNILSKLRSLPEEKQREIRNFLTLSDPGNAGVIPYESFRSLLMGVDCGLCEHEVLVLGRSVAESQQLQVDVGLMLAVAQDLLRKKHFEQFPHLAREGAHRDRNKTGRLSAAEMRTICKACRLPLPENLLAALLSRFSDGEKIDYLAFLAAIDWMEHPLPPVTPDDAWKCEVNVRPEVGGTALRIINYSALLADVFSVPCSAADPEAAAAATSTSP